MKTLIRKTVVFWVMIAFVIFPCSDLTARGGGGNNGGNTGGNNPGNSGPNYAACNKQGCPPCETEAANLEMIFQTPANLSPQGNRPCSFSDMNPMSFFNQVIDACSEDIVPEPFRIPDQHHGIRFEVFSLPGQVCEFNQQNSCTVNDFYGSSNSFGPIRRRTASGGNGDCYVLTGDMFMNFPFDRPIGSAYQIKAEAVTRCNSGCEGSNQDFQVRAFRMQDIQDVAANQANAGVIQFNSVFGENPCFM